MGLICELHENFIRMKPMTLNTMLYDHVYEGMKSISINDFRDDDDPLKQQIEPIPTPEEVHDPSYIRWQMFDEIPERLYTIQCEGYFDKNDKPLKDETSIKHLTSGEPPVDIDDDDDDASEICDEYGNVITYTDHDDYYYRVDHNKYDLRKITHKTHRVVTCVGSYAQ